MQITYIHQHFRTPAMAGGTRSFEFASRLVAKGHSVHLITAAPGGPRSRWVTTDENGIYVHWYGVPYDNTFAFHKRIRAFSEFATAASLRTLSLPSDVVFATSTPLTIAVPGLLRHWARRTPLVFEVRDLWPDIPIAIGALRNPLAIKAARLLERTTYRVASEIVTLSPEMAAGVVRQGGEQKKITVIPNCCDIGLFSVSADEGISFRQENAWLADRPLVTYAGTLGKANAVSYLVEIAASVRETFPEIRFLIVGSGAEHSQIHQLAVTRGVLNRNLFMMPPIPKSQMPRILSASTLALSFFKDLPELQANSPNKVFDALAAGRPVAVNNRGWIADLLLENKCGLSLPPNDPKVAGSMIARSVTDAAWLAAASLNARTIAEQSFSREFQADRLEKVLLRATGQSATHRTPEPSLASANLPTLKGSTRAA